MKSWKSIKKVFGTYTWALKLALKEKGTWMVLVILSYAAIQLMPNVSISVNKAILGRMESGGASISYFVVLLALLLLTLVLTNVGNVIYMFFYEKIRYAVTNKLFEKVLRKINRQPLNAFESTEDNERLERLVGFSRFELNNLISWNMSFYSMALQALVYVVMITVASPVMTIPILFSACFPYLYRMNEAEEKTKLDYELESQDRQADYCVSLMSDLKSQKELRLYGSFPKVFGKWQETVKGIYEKRYRHFSKWNGRRLIYQCAGIVVDLAVLMMEIVLYYNGQITFSTMFFLWQCLFGLGAPIGWIATAIPNSLTDAHMADECREFVEEALRESDSKDEGQSAGATREAGSERRASEPDASASPSQEAKSDDRSNRSNLEPQDGQWEIQLSHVCFRYPSGKFAIKDISLTIGGNRIVALLGENGSGKTTLVKLIMGLYRPDSGQVRYLADGKESTADGFFSCVFQDYSTYHLTLRENVGLGDVGQIDDREKVKGHLQKVLCGDILDSAGGDVDRVLGKLFDLEGLELSGGQWQRLANARALYGNRFALVFDEPTARLDPLAELEQMRELRARFEGRTVILVSHRIGFARMADTICYMKDGEIVEMGSHEELMGRKGEYCSLFQAQAQWYDMGDYDGAASSEAGV